jgi:hypothetical protein
MKDEDKITPAGFPLTAAATILQNMRVRTVESIYEYWLEKRRRLGKALVRQYQDPPPKGNNDPHVAFRPRSEARRVSKRGVAHTTHTTHTPRPTHTQCELARPPGAPLLFLF